MHTYIGSEVKRENSDEGIEFESYVYHSHYMIYLPWKSNKEFLFALRYCYPATILADFCLVILTSKKLFLL